MRRSGLGLALVAVAVCHGCTRGARVAVDDAHNATPRRGAGTTQVYVVPAARTLTLDASRYEFKSSIDAMPRQPRRVRLWMNRSDVMVFEGTWPEGASSFTISEATMTPVKGNVSFLGFNRGDSFEVDIGYAPLPPESAPRTSVPANAVVEPLWSGRFHVEDAATAAGPATSAPSPSAASPSASPSSPRR